MEQRVPHDLATVTFSPSSTIFQVRHLHRPSCHSSNMSNLFSLQGLCTCCSLCLEGSSHRTSQDLLLHSVTFKCHESISWPPILNSSPHSVPAHSLSLPRFIFLFLPSTDVIYLCTIYPPHQKVSTVKASPLSVMFLCIPKAQTSTWHFVEQCYSTDLSAMMELFSVVQ